MDRDCAPHLLLGPRTRAGAARRRPTASIPTRSPTASGSPPRTSPSTPTPAPTWTRPGTTGRPSAGRRGVRNRRGAAGVVLRRRRGPRRHAQEGGRAHHRPGPREGHPAIGYRIKPLDIVMIRTDAARRVPQSRLHDLPARDGAGEHALAARPGREGLRHRCLELRPAARLHARGPQGRSPARRSCPPTAWAASASTATSRSWRTWMQLPRPHRLQGVGVPRQDRAGQRRLVPRRRHPRGVSDADDSHATIPGIRGGHRRRSRRRAPPSTVT